MKQIALDIGLVPAPTLDGFLAGPNSALLQHLRHAVARPEAAATPVYVWGATGSGKTHLLVAARAALLEQGARVGWIDPGTRHVPGFDEAWSAIFMDDVHLYDPGRQQVAFNWFVNAVAPASGAPRWVFATGAQPPADLPLREDLRTRLGWGHVFQLAPLAEADLRAVLRQGADARGIFLGDEVMAFMLSRFSRDLGSLMELLDHLDHYALQTQRPITIPLLKSMLENE
jgi:DnaA family protein